MRAILLAVFFVATVLSGAALACAPAPSCWFKGDPAYLRSLCLTYAEFHQTLKQIAQRRRSEFVSARLLVPAPSFCKAASLKLQLPQALCRACRLNAKEN